MLGARIKEGRHVEGRGRGWATLAGTHGVWTSAADSGYTHTHTHTHSPHRAWMLLQPHSSPQVERTPGSASPGSPSVPLAQAGTRRQGCRGAEERPPSPRRVGAGRPLNLSLPQSRVKLYPRK